MLAQSERGPATPTDAPRTDEAVADRGAAAPGPVPGLRVRDLTVSATGKRGSTIDILRGVSFDLWQGRTLVLLGESGSGKSMTARAILGLLPANMAAGGAIHLGDQSLFPLSARARNSLRGNRIAFIPQDPSGALNPFVRVAGQIVEVLRTHRPEMSRRDAAARAIELLRMVRIADPERVAKAWPHELSGGMRQRVAIAIALSCDPEVLIADEPTTALDVTVQAQMLDLFRTLLADSDSSLLLITHDVGVAGELGDDVAVMYAGRIAEIGPRDEVLGHPRHPYTRALLGAVPRASSVRGTLIPISGQPPHPGALAGGCAFAPRCTLATDHCTVIEPDLQVVGTAPKTAAGKTTAGKTGVGLVEVACLELAASDA